ncbi:hypothetical protein AB0J86_31410 [Micromonospora sp. NPDC049559]|uniref:hypothetical protein n=1 Tax=Micromonospora sp. NPDC049559 TaxID=3155923 RepID=UPI00343BE60E
MRIALVSTAAAAFTVAGAGCSTSRTADQVDSVYCVDRFDRVVDAVRCDDGPSDDYYIWHGRGRYRYGLGSVVSGGQKIRPDDRDARIRVGLPPTGPITPGVITRDGIGSGSGGHSSGG